MTVIRAISFVYQTSAPCLWFRIQAGSQHPDFLQRPVASLSDPERDAEARHYTGIYCR